MVCSLFALDVSPLFKFKEEGAGRVCDTKRKQALLRPAKIGA